MQGIQKTFKHTEEGKIYRKMQNIQKNARYTENRQTYIKKARYTEKCKTSTRIQDIHIIEKDTGYCKVYKFKSYRRLHGIPMAAKYKVCDRNHFLPN
jgi:hypothetical protein